MPLYDSGVQYDFAEPSSEHQRSPFCGPLHVVGDEQIQLAVVIVIEPGGAGAEAGVVDAEAAVTSRNLPSAFVVEEAIAFERGDVDVLARRRYRNRPTATPMPYISTSRPLPRGDIGERAVVVVVIESRVAICGRAGSSLCC